MVSLSNDGPMAGTNWPRLILFPGARLAADD